MTLKTILTIPLTNISPTAITHFLTIVTLPTLLSHVLIALSLAFLPPSAHFLRLTATLLTALLCLHTIHLTNPQNYETSSFADYTFGLAFHASSYLLLLHKTPPAHLTRAPQKLLWGINALFSPRMGVKPYRLDPPGTTKRHFLLRKLLILFTTGIFWLTIRTGTPFYPPSLSPADWSRSKTHLLPQLLSRTLTPRDLWFRATLAFYAYAGSALTINLAHTACALIAVGVFSSPHETWPPLFGDIREAYTLRRWYSHFWHKAMRKAFTLHAVVVTERGLGLRKHTVAGRSYIVMLSFLFSGIMHSVTSDTSDPCCSRFAAVRLFLLFGGAILAEQVVQSAFFGLRGRLGVGWSRWEGAFWRAVGYVWVGYSLLEVSVTDSIRFLRCSQQEGTYDE